MESNSFFSYVPSGSHIMTIGSFTVSMSSISWVTPSNLLLMNTSSNLYEGFRPLPKKSPKEAAHKLQQHHRKDPPCYPPARMRGQKLVFHLNADSWGFSQTGQPLCHQHRLHPVIKRFVTPSIPRKLLGRQSHPKALVHLLTPRFLVRPALRETSLFCITKPGQSVNTTLKQRQGTRVLE